MPRRIRKKEPSPFENCEELTQEVKDILEFLDEEFFIKQWQIKGLDTKSGHETFRQQMNKAIESQSQNIGNQSLFRVVRK